MIRMGMYARTAGIFGPLVCAALATGQDAKPGTREVSVPVTEGRVTVVEGDSAPIDVRTFRRLQQRAMETADRQSANEIRALARRLAQGRTAPDPLQARLGLELAEVDDALRSQLQIPAGQGAVVVALRPEGPAGQSGLRANDVLVGLGNSRVNGSQRARARLLAIGKEPIAVRLFRGGKEIRLNLAGPEQGAGSESPSADYWIGVPISPVDATLRSQLPDLPADAGLIANDVVIDSPAAKAGVKKNDILVKLGGQPLKDSAALVAQVQAAGDKPTPLELIRGGKPLTLTITPARRGSIAAYQLPGSNHVFEFMVPKMGVAVIDPKQREELETVHKTVRDLIENQGKIHLELMRPGATKPATDEARAQIEAGMNEIKASIEELKKAVETLKKAEGK